MMLCEQHCRSGCFAFRVARCHGKHRSEFLVHTDSGCVKPSKDSNDSNCPNKAIGPGGLTGHNGPHKNGLTKEILRDPPT